MKIAQNLRGMILIDVDPTLTQEMVANKLDLDPKIVSRIFDRHLRYAKKVFSMDSSHFK